MINVFNILFRASSIKCFDLDGNISFVHCPFNQFFFEVACSVSDIEPSESETVQE